jgi:hypothetical protein
MHIRVLGESAIWAWVLPWLGSRRKEKKEEGRGGQVVVERKWVSRIMSKGRVTLTRYGNQLDT